MAFDQPEENVLEMSSDAPGANRQEEMSALGENGHDVHSYAPGVQQQEEMSHAP